MKNLLLLFISCFLLLQGSDVIAQTKKGLVKNDLMENKLKGKVKSIIEREFILWARDNSFIDSVKTIQEAMKDSDFSVAYMEDSIYYKFDIWGNNIEKYHDYRLREVNRFEKEIILIYYYNNNKDKQITTKSWVYSSDKREEVITFKYDSLGNIIEQITNNNHDSSNESFIYDNYGKIIEHIKHSEVHFGYNGKNNFEIEKDTFIYDSSGFTVFNKIFKVFYNKNGLESKYGNKSIIRYNKLGLIIEVTKCNLDDSLISESKYKYDSNGNLIEENLSEKKNEGSMSCMGYYEHPYGKKIGDFYRYTYKYDYDKFGNWIYRYEFRKPISDKLTIRWFEYYEN